MSGCSSARSVGGVCTWLLFFSILVFVMKNDLFLYEAAEITR